MCSAWSTHAFELPHLSLLRMWMLSKRRKVAIIGCRCRGMLRYAALQRWRMLLRTHNVSLHPLFAHVRTSQPSECLCHCW